ncbi:PTPLA-domain-containing protein [Lactarius sanguifluus]|nr:PTPLA-domain-containing protein [Lactarius sanguifluus]
MASEPTQPHRDQRKKKGSAAPLIQAYLVAYNLLSAAGWSIVLYQTLAHLFGAPQQPPQHDSLFATIKASAAPPFVWVPSLLPASLAPLYTRACTTYDAVGTTTARVQTAAALEVLHVLLGLVRSPLPTDRRASREPALLRLGHRRAFPLGASRPAQRSPFYASMVLSWALTEVVRYAFYAATLLGNGSAPAPLTWARYSTFFVLYPTGAGSEALVNLATLPVSLARSGAWWDALPLAHWDAYAIARGVLFIAWWPGLYPMYTHMIKQRRKMFGGQKLGAKPKTH